MLGATVIRKAGLRDTPSRATVALATAVVAAAWIAACSSWAQEAPPAAESSPTPTQEAPRIGRAIPVPLHDETWEAWRDHVLPDADELAWRSIPWLSSFHEGILEADRQGKPLLLWVMNGHPLGCT